MSDSYEALKRALGPEAVAQFQMPFEYIFPEGVPTLAENILEWAHWWGENEDMRHVKVSYLFDGKLKVSTIRLPIDHNWRQGAPVLYETMIFVEDEEGKYKEIDLLEWDGFQERYHTEDVALERHDKILKELTEWLHKLTWQRDNPI